MKCTEHNRTHCPEPHCYVMSVCAAELPYFHTQNVQEILESVGWLRKYRYIPRDEIWLDDARWRAEWAATCISRVRLVADRLVSWMRWRGERKAGPICLLPQNTKWARFIDGDISSYFWARSGPGHWHPLDVWVSYEERMSALMPAWQRAEHVQHDGVNWETVAKYLTWLEESGRKVGWAWEQVHQWRPITL